MQIWFDSFLKVDGELVEDFLPSPNGHCPFLSDLFGDQVKKSKERLVIRKHTAILRYFSELSVKAFDRIGGID